MFNPTEAKRHLRIVWDAPLICAVSEGIVRGRLNYFGLPGARLEDIRDWKSYVGAVLALEQRKEDAATLVSNAMVLKLHQRGFKLELGNLDDFILCALKNEQSKLRQTWYHLLNLDYCGGWVYKDSTGDAKRVQALDALAQLQRTAFFEGTENSGASTKGYSLLLMTLNVRSDDKGEVPSYVRERIAAQIIDTNLRKAIGGLPQKGHEHWLLRYYVMHNVLEKMRGKGFNIYAFPPFWYRSGNSTLVHFAFLLGLDRSVVGAGQTVQPSDTLLRLPLVTFGSPGKTECVRVSEPSNLVELLAQFHGLEQHIEEAVTLQRRGRL